LHSEKISDAVGTQLDKTWLTVHGPVVETWFVIQWSFWYGVDTRDTNSWTRLSRKCHDVWNSLWLWLSCKQQYWTAGKDVLCSTTPRHFIENYL